MRSLRVLSLGVLVALVLATGPASAVTPARTFEHTAGQEDTTWDGANAVGANVNYNGIANCPAAAPVCPIPPPRTCTATPEAYCDYTLLALTNPVPEGDTDGKLRRPATVTITDYTLPSPASDFALTLYSSDADANRIAELGTSDNSDIPDDDESVTVQVTTTLEAPTQYILVEVAYFTSAGASYGATLKF